MFPVLEEVVGNYKTDRIAGGRSEKSLCHTTLNKVVCILKSYSVKSYF